MSKVERGVARLALDDVRAVRGSIAIPAGTKLPPGFPRTWSQDGELRASSHDVERWVRDLMRGPEPIKPIKGWR